MNRRDFLRLLGAAGLVASAPGVVRAQRTVPGVSPLEIRFGTSLGLTGPHGPQVYDYLRGFLTRVNELNARGGVHDRRITLLALDHGRRPERALRNTLTFLGESDVFALAAYGATEPLLRILPLLARSRYRPEIEHDVPLFGAWSGAAALYGPPYEGRFIPLRPSFLHEARALTGHLLAQGRSRIAICHNADVHGRAIYDALAHALAERGAEPAVVASCTRDIGAGESWHLSRVAPAFEHVARARPDAVICALDAPRVAEWMRLARARPTPLALPSTVGGETLARRLSQEGRGQELEDHALVQSRVVPTVTGDDPAAVELRRLARSHRPRLPDAWRPASVTTEEPLTAAGLEGLVAARALIRTLEAAGPELDRPSFRALRLDGIDDETEPLESDEAATPENANPEVEGTDIEDADIEDAGAEDPRAPASPRGRIFLARASADGTWRPFAERPFAERSFAEPTSRFLPTAADPDTGRT